MSSRSKTSDSGIDFQPSRLEADADWVFEMFAKLRVHERNRVFHGLTLGLPTTPSEQAAGGGNTTWNVDLAGGMVTVDGAIGDILDTPDISVHAGSKLLDVGQSCIAAVVVKNVAGILSVVVVKGDVALTAAVAAPLDGAITAACGGATVPWVKLAEIQLNRTGDQVLTQSYSNRQRPVLGVNVDTNFGDLTQV